MSSNKNTTHKSGLLAEKLASIFLRLKGYRILERRYQTPVGEIDLIAQKGKTIVMVEVKKRGSHEEALEAISRAQRDRIMRSAKAYLSKELHPPFEEIRFDAIVVDRLMRLHHLKGAWISGE